MSAQPAPVASVLPEPRAAAPRQPRLGFLGVGWIGRQRMQVLADSGIATVAAIADPFAEALDAAAACAPDAARETSLQALLEHDLDGVVIATPSGAHAQQAIAALDRGIAVFCQKPLTRTAEEAKRVIAAAERADRLVDADFSYRHIAGMSQLREHIRGGALGDLFAIDLVFHNAYGPDKPWFYDVAQSGGGCVMDLGIHLVDLAQWVCGDQVDGDIDAHLYAQGRPLARPASVIEDYASAQWRLRSGALVRMSCSWRLSAGCDAVIEAAFYGSRGGAALRNVDGSFYDFNVDLFEGTSRRRLASPPDAWGGRALVDWAERLAAGAGFEPASRQLIDVARVVDTIYGR
jgi:predicted dehydrogenase